MASAKEGLSPVAGKGSGRVSRPDFPHKGCGHRGAKKARHQRKGSGTAGITKPSCKASWQERWACRVSRSYRSHEYSATMRKIYKKAHNGKAMAAFA